MFRRDKCRRIHGNHRCYPLAYEAIHSFTPTRNQVSYEQEALERAYGHANDVTASNSRSFHIASALLPTEKRKSRYVRCMPFVERSMTW